SNFDYPAGSLEDGENEILLKTEGSFKNFGDILETNLKTNEGPLKLKHLAHAKKAQKDFDSFCLYKGERCCALLVFCKKGKSPLKLSKKISALLEEIKKETPNYDFVIESDSSKEIRRTIKSLAANALIGTAVALLLLFLFFKSVKISLAIAAVIPFSLLFTCLILLAFKRSLNIISISGMTICLGMIVDNSIVAMEGVIGKKADKDFCKKLEEGFLQARLSNTASTLTSAIVFVPLFFIGGIIGELFLDLAISLMSGLFFSLFYSFGVLPAICVLFLKEEVSKAEAMSFSWLEKYRQRILQRTNMIRFLCPASALFFILGAFLILLPIKKEFQPKTREDFFCQKISFATGTDIKLVESKTKALCRRIQETNDVQNVFAQGGYEKDDLNFLTKAENKKETAILKIRGRNIKKCKKAVNEILDNFGLEHSLQESQDLISERLEMSNDFLLCADDEESLLNECEKNFGRNFFPYEMSEQKTFKANKKLMEKVKVTPCQLAECLRKAFVGAAASSYFENGREIPMTVQFNEKECASQDKLDRLKIILGSSPLELGSLGEWKAQKEEAALYRRNGRDSKIIRAKTAASAPKEIKKRLVSIQAEGLKSLFTNGIFLLLLVLALLYCVLGAQTESLRLPLYYLTAIPPSFFGAALVLLFFGSSLNVNTIVAFMLLFGTAVNNSIILHESGGKKTPTVFTTSATSIASLLPFAFDPFGTNPQSSLSLAVAGGLAFSTAAVLIMVPNILHWSEK
ncbi:MAG: efflux RND transporter permease subunit, partial [Treponema sp.]|nr:efflux RND transporter permease subunit [Treponema sp.]